MMKKYKIPINIIGDIIYKKNNIYVSVFDTIRNNLCDRWIKNILNIMHNILHNVLNNILYIKLIDNDMIIIECNDNSLSSSIFIDTLYNDAYTIYNICTDTMATSIEIIKPTDYDTILILLGQSKGGTRQYVIDLININRTLHKNIKIYTNTQYDESPGITVLSDSVLLGWLDAMNLIENSSTDMKKKIILHISIHPNYITMTKTEFDAFVNMLLDKKHIELIITVHDYFWLYPKDPLRLYFSNMSITAYKECQSVFEKAKNVIFPTQYILDEFKQKIDFKSIKYTVTDHPDIRTDTVVPYYPLIHNNRVKIMFIGFVSPMKGIDLILNVMETIKTSYVIELYVVGAYRNIPESTFKNVQYIGGYSNDNIFNIINLIQPTILLLATIIPESWSYVASIALSTGLPIFYNDMGAYKERIQSIRTNVASFHSDSDTLITISEKLNNFISFIHASDGIDFQKIPDTRYQITSTPFYDSMYDSFITT